MKLYYNPLSPNVRRVRLTAAVLGLQLETARFNARSRKRSRAWRNGPDTRRAGTTSRARLRPR